MEERKLMDRSLRDLIEIIHFTENVSTKIHGLQSEAEIYRTVTEEFAESKRYNASIFLLTDAGSKLKIAETTVSPEKVKAGLKAVGFPSLESFRVDLNKSSLFSQIVKEEKTIEANFSDVANGYFPRLLASLLVKILSYENRPGILTPLKRHGKVIGILVVDSIALSEYFVPTVKNLSHHISAALELASERVAREKTEEVLRVYMEKLEEKVEERTKELKDTHERLLKAERLATIGEVATMVGHDLRNPLQSIENAAYYLNRQLAQLPSSVQIPQATSEMLQVIKDSVDYADKIVRDLNDFSTSRKATLTKTDINAIVKESLSQVEPPRNVELFIEFGRLPEIEVDKDMMKRIFLNLAANGMQAMENGGILKVSTRNSEGFVEVSFKDDGVGISEENIKNLFTPFFTTKAKGLGMGLAICRGFAEANGGSINVESKKGEGSTFTVRLPIQRETGGEDL